jgi:hypothetical protein
LAEDFQKTASKMQKDFLEKQTGFIKRTLTVSEAGIWTDIVYWKDDQSFKQAIQIAEKSIEVLPFMEKIDFDSVKMNLTKIVLS